MSGDLADAEWSVFIAKLENAEEEFVRGRPAAFQALWSRADDVTLCGGFGGVERGNQNVTDRLSWVSKKYSDGTRTREEISRMVGADFAYLVQTGSHSLPRGFSGRALQSGTAGYDGVSPRGGWLADRASPRRFADGDKASAMTDTRSVRHFELNRVA